MRWLLILMLVVAMLFTGCTNSVPDSETTKPAAPEVQEQPANGKEAYMKDITEHAMVIGEAMGFLVEVVAEYQNYNDKDAWGQDVTTEAEYVLGLIEEAKRVENPVELDEVHSAFIGGMEDYEKAAKNMKEAVEQTDVMKVFEAFEDVEHGAFMIDLAFDLWEEMR